MTSPTIPVLPTLRALSVGEILDASFTQYRRHFGTLATIVLVCELLPLALGAYLFAAGGSLTSVMLAIPYVIAKVVLGAIAVGATVFVVSESYLGRMITASEAFHRVGPRVGAIIVGSLLFGITVAVGFLLFFVPGIVLGCGLVLAIPVIVLESGLEVSAAFSRSWALTHGHKWRMFGLLFTSLILLYLPAAALQGALNAVVPTAQGAGIMQWIPAVVGMVVQVFLTPLLYCVLTVAYYDLRVRKEGFDLELLASSLQPA